MAELHKDKETDADITIIKGEEVEEIRNIDGYYIVEIILKNGMTIKLKQPDIEVCRQIKAKEIKSE